MRRIIVVLCVSLVTGIAYAQEYVPVKADCVVYHSGYKGTIVAPGVSQPSGTVAELQCNGKDVELASKDMVDGIILTKAYGKVKVRFSSMIATVGAGDFSSVQNGKTAPERVRDISVQRSAVKSFTAQFSKQDVSAAEQQKNPTMATPAAPAATAPKAPAKKTATVAKTAAPPALTTRKEKFSYAVGMSVGTQVDGNLKKQSVDVDPSLVSQGFKDVMSGAKPRLTQEEAQAVLNEVQTEVRKQQQEKAQQAAAANKTEGEAFLAANKSKEGVVTLPDGLQYKILNAGTGPKPAASDSVVCNYRGTLITGTEFDSSYKRGQPATFGVGQVIKGWTEALQLMPTGSKWQLFIPSTLAYGERGAGADIGPNATLIFEIELLSIVDKNADKSKDEKKDDKSAKPADNAKPDDKK